MKKLTIFLLSFIAIVGVGYTLLSTNVSALTPFYNGFEVDTDGWFDFGGTLVMTASGTDGYPSSEGSYHAVTDGGVFTRWGEYESVFPTNGFVTEVDVYLDMSEADGSVDKRFDYTSALNNPAGDHHRDYIFHVGTNPTVAGEFFVNVSHNAPGWPGNTGYATLNETGWYTLRHMFMDDGAGVLEVVMEVEDPNGVVVGTWTLNDPTEVIGTAIGGNRYGWFIVDAESTYSKTYSFDRFDTLAIDESRKYEIVADPMDKEECKQGGWEEFGFKNQGQCIRFVNTGQDSREL